MHRIIMTLYDDNRLHNQGSSHKRVTKFSLYITPLLYSHMTTGDDSLLRSLCLLSVTPFLVAVLGACWRCSLRLHWDLGPNQVTFGSSFGHLVTQSKFTRIGRSSEQSTDRVTSWCDLQDMIRPVMREGELACLCACPLVSWGMKTITRSPTLNLGGCRFLSYCNFCFL